MIFSESVGSGASLSARDGDKRGRAEAKAFKFINLKAFFFLGSAIRRPGKANSRQSLRSKSYPKKAGVKWGTIYEKKARLIHIYQEIQLNELDVTAEKVKNQFLGLSPKSYTLLALFQKHNDDVLKLVGISKSRTTWQKYECTKNHLADFLKSRYRVSDLSLKEINHMLLTKEEIKAIMSKPFITPRLEQVRDVFIFSCFCGLAYIDMANLRQENIVRSFDNQLWISGKREKTGAAP